MKPMLWTAIPLAVVVALLAALRPSKPRPAALLAATWEERARLVTELTDYRTLWDVIESDDVDAVRVAAVERIPRIARGQPVVRKLCARLQDEPRPAVRETLIDALAILRDDHPGLVSDTLKRVYVLDPDPAVREAAARALTR